MSRILSALSALVLAAGCVQDPKIEDEVPPLVGITQPKSDGGATTSLDAACGTLLSAVTAARTRLGCSASAVSCPGYLRVAGSSSCGEVESATVAACVSAISSYSACADFDTHPCVVTVEASSCGATNAIGDAGEDAPAALPDSGPQGGEADSGGASKPDAAVGDARAPHGGRGTDAGPRDAARD